MIFHQMDVTYILKKYKTYLLLYLFFVFFINKSYISKNYYSFKNDIKNISTPTKQNKDK